MADLKHCGLSLSDKKTPISFCISVASLKTSRANDHNDSMIAFCLSESRGTFVVVIGVAGVRLREFLEIFHEWRTSYNV